MRRALILLLTVLNVSTVCASVRERLSLRTPSSEQAEILSTVLGADFVSGKGGAFSPKLQVAQVALSEGGDEALVALQRAFCSNHACSFIFLVKRNGAWEIAVRVESWGVPYVVASNSSSMREIVYFDHLTTDCMACSPPKPVRMSWSADTFTPTGRKGGYVFAGPIPDRNSHQFELSWERIWDDK